MLKKIKFKVNGLHCKSCKTLLETEIDVLNGVKDIKVDYQSGYCQTEFDDDKTSFKKIKEKIESFDYQVIDPSTKEDKEDNNGLQISSFIKGLAIPVLLVAIVGIYFIFRSFGGFEILAKLNEPSIGYGLILLIGFLVSFHCVGMCGGLVITYSASETARGKKTGLSLSHIQYNLGRIISYTLVGGILGGLGSFFGINPSFGGAVMLVAGIFMLLMALSLYTNFVWLEKLKLKTPQFIARFLFSQKHNTKPKGPFIIGLLNGLMPCGPLQAMQLYALGTGSFTRGALSMAVYALGTVPLMFGFGAFISFLSKKYIRRLTKFSAIVVAILALIMINRGLINFGLGFRNSSGDQSGQSNGNNSQSQTVNMELSFKGYSPNVLYVKKGVPVRWVINVKEMSGCTDEIIMPDYGIKKTLQYGENIIEFTPKKVGTIKFSCWMKMVWGKFIVTDDGSVSAQGQNNLIANDLPSGGGCGGAVGGSTGGCSASSGGGCGCGGSR